MAANIIDSISFDDCLSITINDYLRDKARIFNSPKHELGVYWK